MRCDKSRFHEDKSIIHRHRSAHFPLWAHWICFISFNFRQTENNWFVLKLTDNGAKCKHLKFSNLARTFVIRFPYSSSWSSETFSAFNQSFLICLQQFSSRSRSNSIALRISIWILSFLKCGKNPGCGPIWKYWKQTIKKGIVFLLNQKHVKQNSHLHLYRLGAVHLI